MNIDILGTEEYQKEYKERFDAFSDKISDLVNIDKIKYLNNRRNIEAWYYFKGAMFDKDFFKIRVSYDGGTLLYQEVDGFGEKTESEAYSKLEECIQEFGHLKNNV